MFKGLLSGVLAGLNTVLISIILSVTPFISSKEALFLAPFVSTFLHDSFNSMWTAIYLTFKGEFIKTLRCVNTRSGMCIIISGLFAGPVGMTSYLLSIKFIGPAYTAIITSLYPAVGAVLSYIFLKEKMKAISIWGVLISIIGILILGYEGNWQEVNSKVGFLWASITVFGLASEAVICSYVMNDNGLTPIQSLQLTQLTSCLIYGFLVIPLIGGMRFTINIFSTIAPIMLLLIALSDTIECFLYYKTIKKMGPTRAMALNITYSAWAIVFGIILLGNSIDIKSIICCIVIMIGAILASLKY